MTNVNGPEFPRQTGDLQSDRLARPRPVTIDDVAELARVSVATVSRALRGLPNVAPTTRVRVEEAAETLRYRPDPAAARLATGRTTTVALAIPVLDSWYFTKVMAGAEAVLSGAGYDTLIFSLDSDETRHRVLTGPLVRRADGLILVDLHLYDDELRALLLHGVRIATIGYEIPGASTVIVDDRRVAREAVSHLTELGHRRIGLISGATDDPQGFAVPQLRREGYHDELRRNGIDIVPSFDVGGNFSVIGGYEAACELLALPEPPTAIFAMSDEMAFGVWRAASERGLSIPDDLSVVGIDDHEVSEVLGLTTVQQQVAEHGSVAAELLLRHLSGAVDEPQSHTVATGLVLRSSTAPPP